MVSRPQDQRAAILLCLAGAGDVSAFHELHVLATVRLRAHAQRIVRSRELAQDVVQESLIAIWTSARLYDPQRGAAFTRMLAIVRNKGADLLRSRVARGGYVTVTSESEAMHMEDLARGPCEHILHQEQCRQIEAALATLREPQSRAIKLAFFEDLSHAEVSDTMKLPLGTVKTFIRRGCQRLRQTLPKPEFGGQASWLRA
jgi:RNA polymerase sigma-70 factor (ECF subfamily)